MFLVLVLKAKFKFNFRSFDNLKILVVKLSHVSRGQRPKKRFLGGFSPRGRSQLKMFCVAPPFIGETNTDELEQRNTISQTLPNWPRKRSVAWRLPPGEEVGKVACFQLHQKCVLGDFQLDHAMYRASVWPVSEGQKF